MGLPELPGTDLMLVNAECWLMLVNAECQLMLVNPCSFDIRH